MMRTRRLAALAAITCLTALALAGCGAGQAGSPDAAAAPEMSPADFQRQFEEQRRRAEEQQQRQAELLQRQRGFVEVAFRELDAEGRVVVTVTNRSGRDIDDLRGGFQAEDGEGNWLASTGFTEAVTGNVFLPAGETRDYTPFGFGDKPGLVERLRNDPAEVRFWFQAFEITYADGSKEPGLEG